ncbi:sensor histidine kinase [Lutibacter sp.]|uniref:sensor histidine kinase n=1 Tax=Lutibacter sp. TaxID=1925666 RepID=UPI001A193096|nr:sensor histidine kinase [Lutibacter sp.]MBI9040362.1 sensor histidine kinase [Lutibacter sp.]
MKIKFKNINPVIIHFLCWVILILINLLTFYNRFQDFPHEYQFYFRISLDVLLFYLNYTLLVPKLLLNRKIVLYILVSFSFILFYSYLNNQVSPPPHLKEMVPQMQGFKPNERIFRGVQILVAVLLFAVGASVKLVTEWYKNEKVKALIETQKINTELSFLKTQLNPHFLFNSLNSIYSLANKKSDATTDAIVTLSELMRYMLYETDKEYVLLKKEIEYIKNYISLQNLRLKDSSGVRFNVHGNLKHYIEPLLLISFIENAFKYGTDYTGKTNINIQISIEENNLILNIKNYISVKEKQKNNSGIGLQNVKSRLNLLYPNAHVLTINQSENEYSVELVLNLKKQ